MEKDKDGGGDDDRRRDGFYSVQMHERRRTIGSSVLQMQVDGKNCAFVGKFHEFRAILQYLDPVLTEDDGHEFYNFGCENPEREGDAWKDEWLGETANLLHDMLTAETDPVTADCIRHLLLDFKYIIIYKAQTALEFLNIFPEVTREKTRATMLAYIQWMETLREPPVSEAIAKKMHRDPTITYLLQEMRALKESNRQLKEQSGGVDVEEITKRITPVVVRSVLTTGEVCTQIANLKNRVFLVDKELEDCTKKCTDSGVQAVSKLVTIQKAVEEVEKMKDTVTTHMRTFEGTMKAVNDQLGTFQTKCDFVAAEEDKRRKLKDAALKLIEEFSK